jgi:hypothetical protein
MATVTTLSFGDVLDAVAKLPVVDQESLLDILQRRLAEIRRTEFVESCLEAEREFDAGHYRLGSANHVVDEILS